MAVISRKRSKKSGLPPGSLIHIGRESSEKIGVSLFEYNAESLHSEEHTSIDFCLTKLKENVVTWIDIRGIHDPSFVEMLGHGFNLHPLLLEDVLNSAQRAKLDDYQEALYIVLRNLDLNGEGAPLHDEQISIILGRNYVITFSESSRDLFSPIKKRLEAANSLLRSRGADYLSYSIIDFIVDHYFVTIEKVDEETEILETELIESQTPVTLRKILKKRHQITLLKKAIWSTREVLSHLFRIESSFIEPSTKLYFQDIYDHVIQMIDTLESMRDVSDNLIAIYQSNISQRMNETMKTLTLVATIFIPLTFISSLYGMNFSYMPELEWRYGYYFALFTMVTVALAMFFFFKKKRWI